MNLLLGNPWGLLALLGIPALIVIHFLQRKAKKILTSTLFLLERTRRESKAGSRFEKFVPSIPFWLQLLSVLLLTALITEPRIVKTESVQYIGFVIDSSASMRASKKRVLEDLPNKIKSIQGVAQKIAIVAVQSDRDLTTLYKGNNVIDFIKALESWQPASGSHDPTNALRLARNLVGSEGPVVFITDHLTKDLAFDASCIAYGKEIDNCGITGVKNITKDGKTLWQALVKNYSKKDLQRKWWTTAPDGSKSNEQTLTIAAESHINIQGIYPPSGDRCVIHLEDDEFDIDNIRPTIIEKPKALIIDQKTSSRQKQIADTIISKFQDLSLSSDPKKCDITLLSYDPLDPTLPNKNAIVFLDDAAGGKSLNAGGIIVNDHPLVNGLNWQPLIISQSIPLELQPEDTALVWQDNKALIFLRNAVDTTNPQEANPRRYQQLIFNFDPNSSNLFKLPATAVLLHRFISTLRISKIETEHLQLETQQKIQVAHDTNSSEALVCEEQLISSKKNNTFNISPEQKVSLTCPDEPAFITIKQKDKVLLHGSVAFADTRESDFTLAKTEDTLGQIAKSSEKRHSKENSYWRIITLCLLALMLLIWHIILRKPSLKTSPQFS